VPHVQGLDGLVDFQGARAGPGHGPAQPQGLGDDLAGLAHQAYLSGRFQLGSPLEK